MSFPRPEFITLSELDHVRITNLISGHVPGTKAPHHDALLAVLDDADLVSPREIPADVITMRSRFVVADAATGARDTLTLVYPQDADASHGKLSVLSPLGTQLLGAQPGQRIEVAGPTGRARALDVVELVYQPEANGDYTA
jgi:regulator of nucleoside diphosphate kinase